MIVIVGSALVAVPVDSYLFNFCSVMALLATMLTTSGWLQSTEGIYKFEMLRLVALAVLAVVTLAGPYAWICLPTLGYVLLNFVYLHTHAERVSALAV